MSASEPRRPGQTSPARGTAAGLPDPDLVRARLSSLATGIAAAQSRAAGPAAPTGEPPT